MEIIAFVAVILLIDYYLKTCRKYELLSAKEDLEQLKNESDKLISSYAMFQEQISIGTFDVWLPGDAYIICAYEEKTKQLLKEYQRLKSIKDTDYTVEKLEEITIKMHYLRKKYKF